MVLFCVKADFNGDEVCLSFCGDNGVRSVLLNASIQYPLVQVTELQEFYIAIKYQQKDVETRVVRFCRIPHLLHITSSDRFIARGNTFDFV